MQHSAKPYVQTGVESDEKEALDRTVSVYFFLRNWWEQCLVFWPGIGSILEKSLFSPPGWVFSVMWGLLYAVMGFSVYLAETADRQNPEGGRLFEYWHFVVELTGVRKWAQKWKALLCLFSSKAENLMIRQADGICLVSHSCCADDGKGRVRDDFTDHFIKCREQPLPGNFGEVSQQNAAALLKCADLLILAQHSLYALVSAGTALQKENAPGEIRLPGRTD